MDQPKWYTCTPVRFPGDETFFVRDSGLLCKGFQEIGAGGQAIMPGPAMEGDCAQDLIRIPYKNLENPAWWKSLGGCGVVFYGWGLGRYVPIVKAIRTAGLHLVTNMDTAGFLSPVTGSIPFLRALCTRLENEQAPLLSFARIAFKAVTAFSWGIIHNDPGWLKHFSFADAVAAVSPIGVDRIRRFCLFYGRKDLAQKIHLIPHPVSHKMTYEGSPKENRVVAIGRWDTIQKDPVLLKKTILYCLEYNPEIRFVIYGKMSVQLQKDLAFIAHQHSGRLVLGGVVPNAQLAPILQTSQILLCTSRHESFHIASAEALCCGCSVVGPDVQDAPAMPWFATEPHGRLAARDPIAMGQAVLDESGAWKAGKRNPSIISTTWKARVSAPQVAKQIIELF
jgi:glycosyltransferase involved in cell wall biosynthesis